MKLNLLYARILLRRKKSVQITISHFVRWDTHIGHSPHIFDLRHTQNCIPLQVFKIQGNSRPKGTT